MTGAAHPSPRHDRDDTRDGHRLLRRHHEATLQYHERRSEVRFVVDGAVGDLVLPADPGFAGEVGGRDAVLHLPDETQIDLQLSITAEPMARPEAEEAVDRWFAYHAASGMLPNVRVWLRCRIDGGKVPHAPAEVYSAESLMRANPFRRGEAALVKQLNADRAALARLCKARARVGIADPLCVGIDPFGIDVRARFGIVRVEFDLEAGSLDQAAACVRSMLERSP